MLDKALRNVILISIGFFLMLSALTVLFNVQKYVLERISSENPNYKADAYIGLCLSFSVYGLFNWFVPSVIVAVGTRTTIFLGFFLNVLYIAQFLLEVSWLYYVGSVLNGVASALFWVAQGHYMAMNSTSKTIARNSGLFWGIFQTSGIVGNLIILFYTRHNDMNRTTRNYLFSGMIFMSILACLSVFLLGRSVYEPIKENIWKTFLQALQLMKTRDMILLSVFIFFNGMECAFCMGVYGSTLGFTKRLGGKDTTIITTSGVLIAIGEVSGGVAFGILGHKTVRWGHYPIVIFGFIIQMVAFVIIGINLPNASVIGPTNDWGLIACSLHLAYLCSFLLGLGDACYATQIYAVVGGVFVDKSSAAFAIYNFFHSIAFAIYCLITHLGLYVNIVILILLAVTSLICFIILDTRPTYMPSFVPSALRVIGDDKTQTDIPAIRSPSLAPSAMRLISTDRKQFDRHNPTTSRSTV